MNEGWPKRVAIKIGYAQWLYGNILDAIDALEGTRALEDIPDRTLFTKFARGTDEPALMFALLDGHDLEPILYRRLRKHGTVNQWKEYTR